MDLFVIVIFPAGFGVGLGPGAVKLIFSVIWGKEPAAVLTGAYMYIVGDQKREGIETDRFYILQGSYIQVRGGLNGCLL